MKTILGVFSTHKKAEDTLKELQDYGVSKADLSYLYVDVKGDMHDDVSKAASGAAVGATTGVVVGALAGLIVANGILPGLGTLFVAGPLAAALGLTGAVATTAAGAATGLAAGALIGGFAKMGINDADAALYQSLVERGDVLVIAHTDLMVKNIFLRNQAEEVREYSDV